MTQEELGRSLFRKLADETAFRQAFKANPTKILPPEANRPMEPAVSDKDMALDQAAAQAAQASPTSGLSEGPGFRVTTLSPRSSLRSKISWALCPRQERHGLFRIRRMIRRLRPRVG